MDNNVDNPNSLPSKDERVTKLETIYEPWMRERPSDGMIVQINFILSLVDGTLIESSRERKKEPFEFVLGSTTVIEGLNIAVRTFGRGERSKVKIASNFAYGAFEFYCVLCAKHNMAGCSQ